MKIKMKTMALVGLMGSALLLTGCGGGGGSSPVATNSNGESVTCDWSIGTGIVCNGETINRSLVTEMSENDDGSYTVVYNGQTWKVSAGSYNGSVVTDILTAQVNGNDGAGVNVVTVDGFSYNLAGENYTHGEKVESIIGTVATGANLNRVDIGVSSTSLSTGLIDTQVEIDLLNNADTINASFGSTGAYTISDHNDAVDSINYLFDNTNAFITVASGNSALDGDDCSDVFTCNQTALQLLSPDEFNGVTLTESELRDQTVVVGALNNDGVSLKSYSVPAGILKNHYIVAPVLSEGEGTSYSAPLVNGVGALLHQNSVHGNLSGSDIKTRILTTADDIGAPGVDDVFGHGRLNVGRALAPVGGLR